MSESSNTWSPGRGLARRPADRADDVRRQRHQAACYVSGGRPGSGAEALAPAEAPAVKPAQPPSLGGLLRLLARWRRAA